MQGNDNERRSSLHLALLFPAAVPPWRRAGIGDRASPACTAGPRRLISCDVFDTLLLRTARSERSRLWDGEQRFAAFLTGHGHLIAPSVLLDARLMAQRLAFRALGARTAAGEVRYEEVVTRQLRMLGLPVRYAAVRLRIEIEIEKFSLIANRWLAQSLAEWREQGFGIVATSDTILPAWAVAELIEHFHGPLLIDHVYSSADLGLTKRAGGIFAEVARREQVALADILHLGDDATADVARPEEQGCRALHCPRPRWRHYVRQANGALARMASRGRAPRPRASAGAHQFGHDMFGPIIGELALMIWCYIAEAAGDGTAVLLFCARGGLSIREGFDRTVERLGLPVPLRCENLAISRLVAARPAVLARSEVAAQELAREFNGARMIAVAHGLGGGAYPDAGPAWNAAFEPHAFFDLLFGPEGSAVLEDIREQDRLFRQHLDERCGDASRLILCDTGLYGSTQRLLAAGMPERRWETIQFARCNYKGFDEDHFAKVTGLAVERNGAHPWDRRSAILRYWQLAEAVFEPVIESVRSFSVANGKVISNAGPIERQALDVGHANPLLAGALSYLAYLRPGDGARILRDARPAWQGLCHAITRPAPLILAFLSTGSRSIDFGRSEAVEIISDGTGTSEIAQFRTIRHQLWREGAIAVRFPRARHLLLPLLDAVHWINAARRSFAR